jgi:hypothetical protein
MTRIPIRKNPEEIEKSTAFIKSFVNKNIERCRKFTDGYIDHPILKDLAPALKHIFFVRLYAHLLIAIGFYMEAYLFIDDTDNPFAKVNPFDIAMKIADAQLILYGEELRKKRIEEILAKAISGDNRAIYKLVKWDKTAISLNFVVDRLAMASLRGDRGFIEKLADALKKKVYDKRKDRNKIYVEYLRYLVPVLKAKYNLKTREVWKKMNTYKKGVSLSDIIREELFKNEEVSSLDDIDYFVKFLKRNNISL